MLLSKYIVLDWQRRMAGVEGTRASQNRVADPAATSADGRLLPCQSPKGAICARRNCGRDDRAPETGSSSFSNVLIRLVVLTHYPTVLSDRRIMQGLVACGGIRVSGFRRKTAALAANPGVRKRPMSAVKLATQTFDPFDRKASNAEPRLKALVGGRMLLGMPLAASPVRLV